MRDALVVGVITLAVFGALYGCYWVAKTVSYSLFYEDMVRNTVRDMVKEGSLK
jgi:hypothetical protein